MSYRPTLFSSLVALALGAAAQPSLATMTWQYLDASGYDANGVPRTLLDLSSQLPTNLLSHTYARLPEGLDINQNQDEKKLLTDNLGANIYLLEDSDITVMALGGNTQYTNSIGFFSYDADNAPQSTSGLNTKIIFPNFSALQPGQAVNLGTFKAGKAVGFAIISDGWQPELGTVNPNQPADKIFYTIRDLNPETPSNDGNSHLNAHTILLSSPEDHLMVLGFEDAYRHPSNQDGNKPLRSDDDFNDVLLVIRVTKALSNVDHTGVQPLIPAVPAPDADGDGISDDIDAFPMDPARAARRFYPNATGYSSLAFEDNWPKKGDFDMNDLVVAYRAVETLNARNEVTDIKLTYHIVARGASNDNTFAVHLPGVPREAIKTSLTTLSTQNQTPTALLPESGQNTAVFILAPSVNSLTKTGLGWPCGFFNTVSNCPRFTPVPLVAEIHFQQPLTRPQIGDAPYDPFIYPNRYAGRSREVHRVDYIPTPKADPTLFGTSDDASNPASARYYRTINNLPWAIDVPETWFYPAEWNDVSNAYPGFVTWAESGGVNAANWYLSPTQGQVIQH